MNAEINRRNFMKLSAGLAGAGLLPGIAHTAAQPKITIISQWSAGSDGQAMAALGKIFQEKGGIWDHQPVPGFTTEMMNRLRAQILAGDPPGASQLKAPEIAAWSAIAPTVNLDDAVAKSGYEKLMAPELARLHKSNGKWVGLPLQVYRMNTLWVSTKALKKVGVTELPVTWNDFNTLAAKMAAAGIQPLMNGGLAWDNAMIWETALAGISPSAFKAALMKLDGAALRGPEVLAAFEQTRKLSNWLDPNVGNQHWSVYIPKFLKGEAGMMLAGGATQGILRSAGATLDDYVTGPGPQDNGNKGFTLNADSFIFWKRDDEATTAGQRLLAEVVMSKEAQQTFSGMTGSVPVRTDIDLSSASFTNQQRNTLASMASAIQADQLLLSLAHNMAQNSEITTNAREVLSEFVHTKDMSPADGQAAFADVLAG